MRLGIFVFLFTAISTIARADVPPPTLPVYAPHVGGDFDFDLGTTEKPSKIDDAKKQRAQADLDRRVKIRRKMLEFHQGFGFATLGLLAVTNVLGTLNYVDKFGGGDFTNKYNTAHYGFAVGTFIMFSATGALALFAPNPYPKKLHFDTAFAHKILMALATAGMVAEIILGPISVSRLGQLDQKNIAIAHVATGWSTFAFMGAGTLVYVF